MPESAEVVVVGGGVMGVSIAFHLARARLGRVILLEKRFVGAGSSGKSGAIIRQHYSHEVTAAMALWSLRFFTRFREETGYDAEFRQPGFLMLVRESDRAAIEGNVALQRSVGVETRLVVGDDLRALDPRARFGSDVGAWEPEGGWVNPLAVLHGFATRARELGADLREGVTVTRIRRDGSRAVGVETDHGPIAAGTVILAAGPWSNRVARASGFELPLTVIRPSITYLARPRDFGAPHPVVGDLPCGIYYRPDAGNLTLIGAFDTADDPVVDDPDRYPEAAPSEFIERCHAAIARRYPALERAYRRGGYSALYTCTPDFHPIIDGAPGIEGLFLVTGFSGHGFKLSPAVGQAITDRLLGRRSEAADLSLFAADRFEAGRTIASRYGYGLLS